MEAWLSKTEHLQDLFMPLYAWVEGSNKVFAHLWESWS